ncbi:MAG: DNA gyrase subunit A, partial [Elusimicrobiota bacterium]
AKQPEQPLLLGKVQPRDIEEEMRTSYIDYAMSVIVGRALPDVRDGFKPVHRRILYTMKEMGLRHNTAYKKSARVVGDCFVKDTLVLTNNGLVPIQDIQRGDKVYTQSGVHSVTQLYEMPPKKLIKVILKNGTHNIVTESQMFKVIDENLYFKWKKAKDLTENDYVVSRSVFPEIKEYLLLPRFNGTKPYLNENLAYLLGHLISDGWIEKGYNHGRGYRVGFCSSSINVINRIKKILLEEFGYIATIERRKIQRGYKQVYIIRINKLEINNFMVSEFNFKNIDASTKFIPSGIFNSPQDVIFSFVSGLIDGDGSVHSERNAIHYGSISEKLINELQVLLQCLGITAKKYSDFRVTKKGGSVLGKVINSRYPFHYLEIRGVKAAQLSTMLKVFNKDKKKKLKRISSSANFKISKYDNIPFAGKIIFEELSNQHIGSGWYKDRDGKKFRMGIKYPGGCKIRYSKDLKEKNLAKSQIINWQIKNKLERLGSKYSEFINEVFKNNLSFIKVAEIKEVTPEQTYDIQVEAAHEFIANGMISHNCLGKYHPHGDTAVYDSMVRMAQDFSLRYTLVEGQGNFGCFTGDTKIKLLDGTEKSFEQLSQMYKPDENYAVYSMNKSGEIVIGWAHNSQITRKNAEVIELTLDTGAKIRCTPDHRFLLRNGTYKAAKDLTSEDSIMPGYFRTAQVKENLNEYLQILQPIINKWDARTYNHKVISIKKVNECYDVWDITVDEYHNFLLADGVFVHNSVDGDAPAHMRYTEVRLEKISDEMLNDIDKDTVDFGPNYDGSLEEPTVLPAKLPNLLINGSSGIAVGMATNIPTHNLVEVIDGAVAVIENPEIQAAELNKIIKGPDFPTAGIICGRQGIKDYFETGRGSFIIRAKAEIEDIKGGKQAIIVREIPSQVNKSTLLETIAELVREKKIEDVSDLRDESDRDGVRVVIEIKRDGNANIVLNQLFKHTQMETSFGVIMLALVGGQPKVLPMKGMLNCYLDHRREVVTRRTRFDLSRAEERAHIVEGLRIAIENLNRIIKLIKESKDTNTARDKLMEEFKLSKIQAQAILDMKLHQLTGLERKKLEEEYLELIKTIEKLKSILADPRKVLGIIKNELIEIKEKYGDTRRTKIQGAVAEMEIEDLIQEEDVVVTFSHAGYVKRIPVSTYKAQRRGGKGVVGMTTREEDFVEDLFVTNTHAFMLFFTSRGKAFSIRVFEIPEGSRISKGKAIVNLVQLSSEEKITAAISIKSFEEAEGQYLFMCTAQGTVKKTALADFNDIRKSGIIAVKLDPGDKLIDVRLVDDKNEIIIATRQGMATRFKSTDIRPTGRATHGVRGIRLSKGDEVVGMEAVTSKDIIFTATENGYGKRTDISKYRLTRRGGKGVKNMKTTERNGLVIGLKKERPGDEIMLITAHGQTIRLSVDDILIKGRNIQGVRLVRLEEGDKLASIAHLVKEENGNGENGSEQATSDK